ncbi:MAG: helix-turn-helix transcriptional regulator [Pseudomonadota bacterium]
MTDAVWQIERRRRQYKLSHAKLAALAGINRDHYQEIITRKVEPRQATIAKLRLALSRHEFGGRGSLPLMIYRLCLLYVCQSERVDLESVLAQDPKRRATFDPIWKQAADMRGKALYIAHAVCGVPQRQLAAAAGMTPAAVSLAMGRVEGSCEPDEVPLFQMVDLALGGF